MSPSVQSRIALAILEQAVFDLACKDIKLRVGAAKWLNSDGAKEVCKVIGLDYATVWELARSITFRPYAQRRLLAKSFTASL